MDIYTAASLQPPYRYPRTTRTSNTGLVGPVEAATAIAGIPLCRSPSLLHTDSPSSNNFPSLLLLVSTSNKYNSYGVVGGTAQVAYPA
jgi:hypothetical protein